MKEINYLLKNRCGIYIITNVSNGKRYIGSSINIYNRLLDHKCLLKRGDAWNAHFQAAWNKYGESSFEYGILEFCKEEERFEREQFYLNMFKPEYNLTTNVVANYGHPCKEETKQKISETLKRRYTLKEIVTYKQEHNWIHCYLYDAYAFTFIREFKNTAECAEFLNYRHGGSKDLMHTFIMGRYIVTDKKFECLSDLKNYVFKYFRKLNISPIWGQRYLVSEDNNGVITYYKSIIECSKCGPSKSMIMKHLDATKENPYINVKFPNIKIYFLKEFENLPYDATLIPEGICEKSIKNGRICDDNTVVTEEIKESSAPYSVEAETVITE